MEVLLILAFIAVVVLSVECPGKPTAPCWGTSTHTCPSTAPECAADECCGTFTGTDCTGTAPGTKCVSYSDCDTTCCTKNYTGCGGTAPGTKCVSYSNCDTTCCTKNFASCGGSHYFPCDGYSAAECWEHPQHHCCRLSPANKCIERACIEMDEESCEVCECSAPTGSCAKKACSALGSEANCTYCGCTPAGTCPKKGCSTLAVGNCAYCGCTVTGSCPPKACSTWATFDCSPTGTLAKCKACGCECCYHISTACEITTGFTCGGLVIDSGGQVMKTGGTITICSYWQKAPADPTAHFYSTLPVGLQIKGGNPCCP